MSNIKRAILDYFSIINNRNQESAMKDLQANRDVAKNIIKELRESDKINPDNLSLDQNLIARNINLTAARERAVLGEQTRTLNLNEISDVLDYMHWDQQNLINQVNALKALHNNANSLDEPLGSESKPISTWLKSADFVVNRNKSLSNSIADGVETDVQIKEVKRSVMDYCDPNLEQPSHMDPDD